MPVFLFNKLIRDKLPALMEKHDITVVSETLSHADYIQALKSKLVEETQELYEATEINDIVAEAADIKEVLIALAEAMGFDLDKVESERLKKRAANGSFQEKKLIVSVDIPKEDGIFEPFINNYRDHPEKYPELKS